MNEILANQISGSLEFNEQLSSVDLLLPDIEKM